MKTTEKEPRRMNKKETKSWTFHGLFYVSREGEQEEAACLPCRFFNIVKIHSEITAERREKTMEKNGNSQLSNDLIWVNKERFFSSTSSLLGVEKYRLLVLCSSRPRHDGKEKLSNSEKMIWTKVSGRIWTPTLISVHRNLTAWHHRRIRFIATITSI